MKTVALTITIQRDGIVAMLPTGPTYLPNAGTVGDLATLLADPRIRPTRARPADIFDKVASGLRDMFLSDDDDGDEYDDEGDDDDRGADGDDGRAGDDPDDE